MVIKSPYLYKETTFKSLNMITIQFGRRIVIYDKKIKGGVHIKLYKHASAVHVFIFGKRFII